MKRREILTDFLVGGCIGKTLMEVSGIVTNLVVGNISKDLIEQLISLIIIFIIGGIGYIVAKMSVRKIDKKDMTSKDRQKLLKKQMLITAGSILFFSVFIVIYTIQRNYVGIILALSFSTVFSFWGYAFLLSYINLKNNMVMINKKV
ncbi:MAG: hypothetical protein IJK18_05770 [Clostridia bacterium]|nr:hypothetical protein [Clostridia bacterium]